MYGMNGWNKDGDELISKRAVLDGAVSLRLFDRDVKIVAVDYIEQLPAAQPEYKLDERCDDCKEYNHEQHCCPRWNRVIRQTLADAQPQRKKGRWIWMGKEGDSRYSCSVCKCKEHVPTCNGNPDIWWYCPNCGADMRGEQDGLSD